MTLLLIGAAGRIGSMPRERLPAYGWDLRVLDSVPLEDAIDGDATDPAVLDAVLAEQTEAIVHLAGQPTEAPWPVVRDANVEGLHQLFEAVRRHDARRVVWASSNHAVGFTPRSAELAADTPPRPDTLYGASKAFGEALARYYVDRYDLQVACLRIGTCAITLPDRRSLATWLSPDDCARLVDAAVRAPDLRYAIVWGVSANTRRWWSLDAGRAIGYEPQDDAEAFAPGLADSPSLASDDLVGGGYTVAEFGIDEVASRG